MHGNNGKNGQAAHAEVEEVLHELAKVRGKVILDVAQSTRLLDQIHPNYRESARNLLHYLSLRRHDLRKLQTRLAALGLSSIGRAEAHVVATIDSVLRILYQLSGQPGVLTEEPPVLDFKEGTRLLAEHTEALFGPTPNDRRVRIMVTMPTEAASDPNLIRDLMKQGMNCMRINCAHDDAATWSKMIEHLRTAEKELGKSCRVFMDLAGPKLRTGIIEPAAAVIRVRPARDSFGHVVCPARIWISSDLAKYPAPQPCAGAFDVADVWLGALREGQKLRLQDARGSKRELLITEALEHGCWAESNQTCYVVPGTKLIRDGDFENEEIRETVVRTVPERPNYLRLCVGDALLLTREAIPGRPAIMSDDGRVIHPAQISCTLPVVLEKVKEDEAIWFDDGKIGGRIEKVRNHGVMVRITHARPAGDKLRADKGINLPDTAIQLGKMTDKDIHDLAFVARHADAVQLSFANKPKDVAALQEQLLQIGNHLPAIVLKIETKRGFENLPEMLLTAMKSPVCGVMIARGDLAIECGFERLAEVQEEILWICEAAHIPVIWATQVLESMARTGVPSRAEISDAAMGQWAECVMLNKGPHIVGAVRTLDDILTRMQAHHAKKSSRLRGLKLARKVGEGSLTF